MFKALILKFFFVCFGGEGEGTKNYVRVKIRLFQVIHEIISNFKRMVLDLFLYTFLQTLMKETNEKDKNNNKEIFYIKNV